MFSKISYSVLAGAVLILASCNTLDFGGMIAPQSDHVDKRFQQSMQINSQIRANSNPYAPIASVSVNENDYRLYSCGDSHVEKTTKNMDIFVRDFLSDTQAAPFALCVGDVINGKGNYNLAKAHLSPILDGKGKHLFLTAGNHDLYFDQWKDYKETFGSATYTFEVVTPSDGKDLFVALESGSGTLGKEQRKWLSAVLDPQRRKEYRNVIVFTHTHFFMRDYSQGITDNFPIEESMDLFDLFDRSKVLLVISGHDHTREETTMRGVLYSTMDALKDECKNASYCVYHIGKNSAKIGYVKL